MKRCPSAILSAAPAHEVQPILMAMQLYNQYDARQALPAAGGWLDQSPTFLALVSLVDGERAYWDRQREKALEKKEKGAARGR